MLRYRNTILAALAVFALVATVSFKFTPTASAEMVNGTVYNSTVYSAAGTASTAVYSTAFRVSPNTKKSIGFYGYSTTTTTIPSGGAMSGTAALQVDVTDTGNGPWVPAKDMNGTVITGTANATWNIDTSYRWFRVVWTKTGSANQKLLATLNYHD